MPQLRQNPGQIACKLFVRVLLLSQGVTARETQSQSESRSSLLLSQGCPSLEC